MGSATPVAIEPRIIAKNLVGILVDLPSLSVVEAHGRIAGVISTINVTEEYPVDIPATPDGASGPSLNADHAALMAAHEAGRAEERADVRRCIVTNAERMLGEMAKSKSATFKRSYRDAIEVLVGLGDIIAKGAHVGAAKKGAPMTRAEEKQKSRDDAESLANGSKSPEQLREENAKFAFPAHYIEILGWDKP